MTFPLHSCPTDILQIIFKDVALSEDKQLRASITLSHVCWSWRRTALATPRLWASITLRLQRQRPVIDPLWDEVTRRAGSVPLVIKIEASQAGHDTDPPSVHLWLDLRVVPVCKAHTWTVQVYLYKYSRLRKTIITAENGHYQCLTGHEGNAYTM